MLSGKIKKSLKSTVLSLVLMSSFLVGSVSNIYADEDLKINYASGVDVEQSFSNLIESNIMMSGVDYKGSKSNLYSYILSIPNADNKKMEVNEYYNLNAESVSFEIKGDSSLQALVFVKYFVPMLSNKSKDNLSKENVEFALNYYIAMSNDAKKKVETFKSLLDSNCLKFKLDINNPPVFKLNSYKLCSFDKIMPKFDSSFFEEKDTSVTGSNEDAVSLKDTDSSVKSDKYDKQFLKDVSVSDLSASSKNYYLAYKDFLVSFAKKKPNKDGTYKLTNDEVSMRGAALADFEKLTNNDQIVLAHFKYLIDKLDNPDAKDESVNDEPTANKAIGKERHVPWYMKIFIIFLVIYLIKKFMGLKG